MLRSSGRGNPFFARTKMGGCSASLSGIRPQTEHLRKKHMYHPKITAAAYLLVAGALAFVSVYFGAA
jgi:hypothetical protein